MRQFFEPTEAPYWLKRVLISIREALADVWSTPIRLAPYNVADVPPAEDWLYGLIFVPDESGGAVPAFSDGSDWRRCTDRAVIS